jgi:ribonuclease HII
MAIKRISRAESCLERDVWCRGGLLCGVDEVGRGCLAGPVVTAAVMLHPHKTCPLLTDSKLLSQEQRIRAARWICEHSWYAYGVVSHYEIDRYNIYQATLCAMRRAVLHMCSVARCFPDKIVVDAMPLVIESPLFRKIEVAHFIHGEMRSVSIAAASILAKVKRDELMCSYNKVFPGYVLSSHKGYATRIHCEALRVLGHSIIHRQSFLSNINVCEDRKQYEEQISLLCRSN